MADQTLTPSGDGQGPDPYASARARIGAQQGRLRGWRPLAMGADVAVVAVQVLGMAAHDPLSVGLRVMVAARDAGSFAAQGLAAAEAALRKRGVLGPDDPFELVHQGQLTSMAAQPTPDDPLSWPYVPLTIHVAVRQLPAIAGLATDAVLG